MRWRNDPEIRDNTLGYRFPITEAVEAHWVEPVLKDQSRTRVVLAIEDKSDGAFVSFVYLNNIDWFARNAEFGILIGERSRHGRGLARDALELIVGYAFKVRKPPARAALRSVTCLENCPYGQSYAQCAG